MLALALIPILICVIAVELHQRRRRNHISVESALRALLDPPGATTASLLSARAAPNERLIRAFNLGNIFVSPLPSIHTRFLTQSHALLKSAALTKLPNACRLRAAALNCSPLLRAGTCFSSTIQALTLRVVLIFLLSVPEDVLDEADIVLVSSGINTLWQHSKTGTAVPAALSRDVHRLLGVWLPDHERPLDFLLPAYETLWRVLATALARGVEIPHALDVLRAFVADPTPVRFGSFKHGLSAHAVVLETLRLHPPTARIARAVEMPHPLGVALPRALGAGLLGTLFPFLTTNQIAVERADVRAAHRDPEVWGTDAEMFDPARFHPDRLTERQKTCMYAFGFGRLKCIAREWAPMATAIIAGTVVQVLEEKGLKITGTGAIGGRDGWEGWVIREKEVAAGKEMA